MTGKPAVLTLCLLAGTACTPLVAPAPLAGTQYDGSYSGTDRVTRGAGFMCGQAEAPQRFQIINGHFDYPFAIDPTTTSLIPVQVSASGALSGRLQYQPTYPTFGYPLYVAWVTVTGQINAGTLSATVDDPRCTHQVLARRE